MSVNHFLAHVPVTPMMLGAKKLWDRTAIDAWLDGDAGKGNVTSSEEWLDRA